MRVIPAINATDFETVKKQILQVADFSFWIHLDVVDGKFAPNVLWGKADDIKKIKSLAVNFEAHLMVERPELAIEAWLENGIKRIVIHAEAVNDRLFILNMCQKFNAEAGLAIRPDTQIEKITPFLKDFKFVQILAVNPGFAGQKFDEKVLEKVKFLRTHYKDVIIEVDGGINPETAKLVKKAGADIVVSASYIFSSKDPKKAYEELQKI